MTWSSEEFFKKWPTHSQAREAAIVREAIAGNVPSWMHEFHGVGVTDVAGDYFAIGTDQDYVRVPLTAYAAAYLCKHFGYELPKYSLVDQIWRSARPRLRPLPETWNYKGAPGLGQLGMNYRAHSYKIDDQIGALIGKTIVAGHKKDVIGIAKPGRLALYGWTQLDGKAIQPLSYAHDSSYVDYSHGVRFVKPCEMSGLPFIETMPAEFLREVTK